LIPPASIIPVLNAFFIMAIVLMLFAIIGVTFFESDAPEEFGNLSRSIIVMFRIAGMYIILLYIVLV